MEALPEDSEVEETDLPSPDKTAIFAHREKFDLSKSCDEQRMAQDDWDKIETFIGVSTVNMCSRIITYEEALYYFKEKDLSPYMLNIRPVLHRSGIKQLLHRILGPPRLKMKLVQERGFVFALAHCPFDNTDTVYLEILQTIYRKLTNSVYDCPRYGNHWEKIGFQGTDPSTDLRGVGLLGILQLLFLTMGLGNAELVNDIYRLSRDKVQNFPFAAMSLNITKISLEALREEVLNRLCNEKDDLVRVVNEFYAGTFLILYLSWKNRRMTIKDSGFAMKDISDFVKKRPFYVLQNLKDYEEERSSLPASETYTNLTTVNNQ